MLVRKASSPGLLPPLLRAQGAPPAPGAAREAGAALCGFPGRAVAGPPPPKACFGVFFSFMPSGVFRALSVVGQVPPPPAPSAPDRKWALGSLNPGRGAKATQWHRTHGAELRCPPSRGCQVPRGVGPHRAPPSRTGFLTPGTVRDPKWRPSQPRPRRCGHRGRAERCPHVGTRMGTRRREDSQTRDTCGCTPTKSSLLWPGWPGLLSLTPGRSEAGGGSGMVALCVSVLGA